MYKILLSAFFIAFLLKVNAQQDTTLPYFVHLNNGTKVYGNIVEHKTPFLANAYLLVDDIDKFKLSEVAAYQDREGYFKKFKSGFGWLWYKREVVGKINMYSRITTTYNSTSPRFGGVGYNSGYYTKQKTSYIQVGLGQPMHIKYKNILPLVSDDPVSLGILKRGHKNEKIKWGLTIAGGGLLLAGAVISATKLRNDTQNGTSSDGLSISPLVIGGVAVLVATVFIPNGKNDYEKAVLMYNRKRE